MRLNLVPRGTTQLTRSPQQSVTGYALALSFALLSSCDDGIGHPIDAAAHAAGASARKSSVAGGAGGSAAKGSGGSITVTTLGGSNTATLAGGTASGGSRSQPAVTGLGGVPSSFTSAITLIGGNASGGRSNQFTILLGVGGVPSTRSMVTTCSAEEPWPETWAESETDLANLIYLARLVGLECGTWNQVESKLLDINDPLRCFARQRSTSRSRNVPPADTADFEGLAIIERQGGDDMTASEVFLSLWDSADSADCNTLMSDEFRVMEVGFAALSGQGYWTIALAK